MPQLQYACPHRPRCQKVYTKQGNLVRHVLRDHRTDCSVGLDGEEMDLDNTTQPAYTPVGKLTTLRYLLSLAAHHGWHIDHMDVVTAFLNPSIDRDDVYMCLPPGMDWINPSLARGQTSQERSYNADFYTLPLPRQQKGISDITSDVWWTGLSFPFFQDECIYNSNDIAIRLGRERQSLDKTINRAPKRAPTGRYERR
jgi:hypothetical protein